MTNKTCELLLTLLSFAILCAVEAQSESSTKSCNVTRLLFREVSGYPPTDFHVRSQDDGRLQVCSKKNTCCTQSMEAAFAKQSEVLLSMMSRASDEVVPKPFLLTPKFQEFYISLIRNAFKDLDDMFKLIYHDKYVENKELFVSLFKSLEMYMNGTELDLKQLTDNFFSLLYQKVYILFNDEYVFNQRYQSCILESAEAIKPFGDSPRKIGLQISRSLLASKVYLEGLKIGKHVVNDLLRLETRKECARAFLKMMFCGMCHGVYKVRPCYKYCINVMKGCFAYRTVVNTQWNNYVNALLNLGAKLEGPFSMEAIMEPLGVKISEAIMFFKDRKNNITDKVKQQCGLPPVNRTQLAHRRLGVRSKRSNGLGGSFPFDLLGAEDGLKPTTAAGTNLDRLVRDVRESLAPLRDHWIQMAYGVCLKSITDGPNVSKNCWNGNDLSGYELPVAQDGIPGMFYNPEVHLNVSDPEMTVRTLVLKLQTITQRITNAIRGADSNTIDIEEENDGSGSGKEEGSAESGIGPSAPSNTIPTRPTAPSNTIPPRVKITTPDNTVEEINRAKGNEDNSANNVERDPFNIYQPKRQVKDKDNMALKVEMSAWLVTFTFLIALTNFIA